MKRIIFLSTILLIFSTNLFAQAKCFSETDVKKIINSINTPLKLTENKELRRELLDLQKNHLELNRKVLENFEKNEKFLVEVKESGKKNLWRLCEIFRNNGWLRKENIGEEGVEAMLYIFRNSELIEVKKEFFPIFAAAAKKGLIRNDLFASIIDSIRVGSGLPQIFGTQTEVKDEMFYLYPLLNEQKVDEWRKLYGLPPLSVFIKNLEVLFRMPVLKTERFPTAPKLLQKTKSNSETKALGLQEDENEVIKVETDLVNLNVRVLNEDFSIPGELSLQKEDFTVFENEQEQEVKFFSTADTPFDLILLLDMSGSMREKTDLVIESTKRFIRAARPTDRVAIVSFGDYTKIEADLTSDKKVLLDKANNIGYRGGSKVWDALKFAYENIIKTQSQGRRSAIVFMTDGVDTSLIMNQEIWKKRNERKAVGITGFYRTPQNVVSQITFTDLLETVKQSETTVFPIYLDTETLDDDWVEKAYRQGRKTLGMIAEESGGQYYAAKKVKDLNGIYEKIINDLSKVYSLGYEPKNENRNNLWRKLTVKVKNRPSLIVRTRRGYYAK